MDQHPDNASDHKAQAPAALLLCTDLLFAVQLQNMARKAGLRHLTVRPGAPLPDGDVLIVDIAARADWEAAIAQARERGIEVVAFGPHMDSEGRRRAKQAGASRVLANSNLARDLPLILQEVRSKREEGRNQRS